jgi:hypothetical protein
MAFVNYSKTKMKNIITAHTGMVTWEGVHHWVPPSKKAWDWYTGNRNGDVHIFEDVHLREHVDYDGKIKIALLEEVPTIYDYANQFDPNMFHPYKWFLQNHQHFDYVFSNYKFLKDIVGEEKYHWICFYVNGIAPEEYGMYEKERLISIIVSHKNWISGHRMRHEVVGRFGKHIDVYGKGYNTLIDDFNIRGKIIALAPYYYSIIIPNTNIDDFFSEQVTDCLAVGTIPVFCGTQGIKNHFNMDGIVTFNSLDELGELLPTLTKDLYHSKINAIADNLERARKLKTTVDWIYDNKKDWLENLKK